MLIRVLITASIPIAGLVYVFITMTPEGVASGKKLYETHCSNCHGKEGQGLRSLYPKLAGSDYLKEHQVDLPCMILYGMEGPIMVNGKAFNAVMPGVESLNPKEVWKIMEYINSDWGNNIETVPYEKVKAVVKRCPQARKKMR